MITTKVAFPAEVLAEENPLGALVTSMMRKMKFLNIYQLDVVMNWRSNKKKVENKKDLVKRSKTNSANGSGSSFLFLKEFGDYTR